MADKCCRNITKGPLEKREKSKDGDGKTKDKNSGQNTAVDSSCTPSRCNDNQLFLDNSGLAQKDERDQLVKMKKVFL